MPRTGLSTKTTEILELLKTTDLTFQAIADKYGVTKSRVGQISQRYGKFNRSKTNRKYWTSVLQKVLDELTPEMDIKAIASAHNLSVVEFNNRIRYYLGENLITILMEQRNEAISRHYIDGLTAKGITLKNETPFLQPNQITSQNSVYMINTKNGVRRYPKIGDRSKGGTFEDPEVMKFINRYKNKGYTFKEITDKLNACGYKTVSGLPFKWPNVSVKYNKFIKPKLKK